MQNLRHAMRIARTAQRMRTMSTVELNQSHLSLSGDKAKVEVNYSWLRDHCRCDKCLHPVTGQKMNDTRLSEVKASEAKVIDDELRVLWADGHESSFDKEDLTGKFLAREDKVIEPFLWNKNILEGEKVEKIPYEDFMKDETALKKLVKNVIKFGFGLVQGAPSGESEESMERLGPIMVTHEGRLEIIGQGIKHNDISYGNAYLPMHTDLPYMVDPPGVTFLHCLERECDGGDTLIVDGFKIADDLRKNDPEGFKAICEGMRRFQHQPPGIFFTNRFPVCNLDPFTTNLNLIRYGTIYMQELNIPQSSAERYYRAMREFDEMVNSDEYVIPVTLEKGDQIFLDNWRLIHGRTAFEGKRILAVCSMKKDDFLSRGRMLGVI